MDAVREGCSKDVVAPRMAQGAEGRDVEFDEQPGCSWRGLLTVSRTAEDCIGSCRVRFGGFGLDAVGEGY